MLHRKDEEGKTAALWSTLSNTCYGVHLLRILRHYGADFTAVDGKNKSLLHYAIECSDLTFDVIRYLIKYPDVSGPLGISDADGSLALIVCALQ